MTTNHSTPCRVLRCLTTAAWLVQVTDDGRPVTSGHYCPEHAAQNVAALPRPGRRVQLDALDVLAVAR